MNITAPIGATGRYKIIKVRDGLDVEESPWNDNAFLYGGIAFMLHNGANTIACNVWGRNINRSSSSLTSVMTTRNSLPDADGNLMWRTTYRFSFPAAEGQPAGVLTNGGIGVHSDVPVWVPVGAFLIPSSGARMSEAALIGTNGEESVYFVDMATESFDVVWEFTEYVKAEATGTAIIRTIKSGVLVSDAETNWRVLPANFDNTSDSSQGWLPVSGLADFPAMLAQMVTVGAGTIGGIGTQPMFTDTVSLKSLRVNDVVMVPAIKSNVATVTLNLGPDNAVLVNVARFKLGHFDFQCEFDPPIDKKKTQEMDLSFTVSIHNRG